MADLESTQKDPSNPDSYHPCPSCGLSFSTAILVCPHDGSVIRQNHSLRNSLHSRYEFISEAGSGGAGVVYKAKQKSTGKLVAIKMVSLDQVNKESQSRFQAEANACSRLIHDNLIRLHDYGITESGQPYIVLEYIDGIDLSELLKKAGGVSLRTSLEIAEQLCSGLQHAHAQEILHRDLKPGNVMITWTLGHPHVKIVDFSIAKLSDEKSPTSQELMKESEDKSGMGGKPPVTPLDPVREIVGTPAYMSPEQILGKELDQRSDLYSLGCVIFQMLVGAPPCQGKNSVQTVFKQLNEDAPSLSKAAPGRTFPQSLENIVAKLLKKNPADRYKTAGDLLDDLRQVLAELSEKETIQAQSRTKQQKKDNKKVIAGIPVKLFVVVVLVASCIGALFLTKQSMDKAAQKAHTETAHSENSHPVDKSPAKKAVQQHKATTKKTK